VLAVCLAGSPIMFLGHQMKAPTVALGALLLVPCLLAYADGWPFPQPAGGGLLDWLGKRTYSIYLWQQTFTICFFLPIPWWPLGAVVSVFVGAGWFHFFERPFLSAERRAELPAPAPV
jgi:peptidoglycan/LPS O-acetylase OafA/YrhL